MLQTAIVAMALGLILRGTPPGSATSLWPYLLAAYAALSATAPWLAGGVSRGEFRVAYSAFLGLVFAAPLLLSSSWLWPTPYRPIALVFCVLAALWAVHFLVSVVIRTRGRSP